MLSPRAIHLFLKYFDSIDQSLSSRLVRRRTWDEEALTFLLTELLDDEAQVDHNISYPHHSFLKDLSATDEPLAISVQLDTHSYPKSMERYVTQSDIGFILTYQDQFNPKASFRSGWLLQAKRLFHSTRRHEHGFTVNSQFGSVDYEQHARMVRLRDWAKCDFIRYLLYCPRPSGLERGVREQLSSARSIALSNDIFDYALGLELRDDLLSASPTTAAGMHIALLDALPDSLLKVHQSLFHGVTPFSWFIVSQLARNAGIRGLQEHELRAGRANDESGNLNNPIIDAIIRGDSETFEKDSTLAEVMDDPEQSRILPAHTITVRVVNGLDRPRGQ